MVAMTRSPTVGMYWFRLVSCEAIGGGEGAVHGQSCARSRWHFCGRRCRAARRQWGRWCWAGCGGGRGRVLGGRRGGWGGGRDRGGHQVGRKPWWSC